MKHAAPIYHTIEAIVHIAEIWKKNTLKVIFTNGCFDVIHAGHMASLAQAASLGDKLIVGLNSDLSVRHLKGEHRPILDELSRATILAGLRWVDAVVIFEEPTPLAIIKAIRPTIYTKGGDYTTENLPNREEIKQYCEQIIITALAKSPSSTDLIHKIKNL